MADDTLPTPGHLRQLLHYEPDTGKLFWKARDPSLFANPSRAVQWNGKNAGKEAFIAVSTTGYYRGAVWGRFHAAHRIIWAIVHGEWPADCIDHINGDPKDNRLANLRAVSRADNQKNQKRRKDNTSGVSGVSWDKSKGLWQAKINVDGRQMHLGRYETVAEAAMAKASAEQKYGFHENHGKR
jgi:hypothetical protein